MSLKIKEKHGLMIDFKIQPEIVFVKLIFSKTQIIL